MTKAKFTEQDLTSLEKFIEKYPSWWWTIGVCDVSFDFSAAPQARSPEIVYAEIGNEFDEGFMCDHPESLAEAIRDVMSQIEGKLKNIPV